MRRVVIIDTGPVVAFLNKRDRFHDWAVAQFALLEPPLLTCEAVISEACFLVRGLDGGESAILELISRGAIEVPFTLQHEVSAVQKLMARYASAPMSLADACIVRTSELHADSRVMTFDGHFAIYRRHGHSVIPLITPEPGRAAHERRARSPLG